MERVGIRAFLVATAAVSLLAGCQTATEGSAAATEDAPVARAETSVRLVDRDVEAPQVFQVSDEALWDGRPSLGGVWVASPDATDPERVILRNPANGKFVIGALFRRERLNPGPALQISSDAAAALGILAGQPSKVSVTALRREEAEEPAAPEATAPILDSNEAVETTTLAAAAIDRAEGKAPAPADETAIATAPLDEATQAPPPADAAVTETAAAEPAKKRKGWLFGKRKAAEAESGIETAALPAAETGVVTPVAAVAPAPAAKPVAPAARTSLIQIGIFSVGANADRAVKMLTAKGISARKLTETSQGKTFWRVVADAPDRAVTLASVRAAGFADAYPVSR